MPITRDLFLGFIKVHILYHAKMNPIFGVELIKELKRHGYQVSPGLIYPTLHSLEKEGYLKRENRVIEGKVRKYYVLTPMGLKMLEEARVKIRELVEEVMT
jgi:DNA-binding PadR family transcriptional regulator